MDYTTFPPVVNQASSADSQMETLIADLMAGRNKKQFKGVGQALIGSLLNVVGSGLSALGVSGASGIGTELLGQEDPNKTKDLAFLLAHMSNAKTAREQIKAETEKHVATLKSTAQIQNELRKSQEKIAEMQARIDEQRTIVGAAVEVKKSENQMIAQGAANQTAREEAEKDRKSREAINLADITARKEISETRSDRPTPAQEQAEMIARSISTQLATVAKDSKDPGSGIIQNIVDLATDENVSAVYQQAGGKMSTLQAIEAVHGKDFVTKYVRDYIKQQAQGSGASPEMISTGVSKANQRVTDFIEKFVKTDPGLSSDPKLVLAYRAAASVFSDFVARTGEDVNTVYSTELKNFEAGSRYAESIQQHLDKMEPSKGWRDSWIAGANANVPLSNIGFMESHIPEKGTKRWLDYSTKYNDLRTRFSKEIDPFNPTAAKSTFDKFIAEVNSSPAFSWYSRNLPQQTK